MEKRVTRPLSQPVITGLIGLFLLLVSLPSLLDYFSPKVSRGQSISTLVSTMGEPTEKYFAPAMVDGHSEDGKKVLVYRYRIPGPAAGDIIIHIKNGKVADAFYP